jgi:hypothetical protein
MTYINADTMQNPYFYAYIYVRLTGGAMSTVSEQIFDLENAAHVAAIGAGAVAPCHYHRDLMINQGDVDAERRAYAIVINLWKAGRIACEGTDLTAAVHEAIALAADACPQCKELEDA